MKKLLLGTLACVGFLGATDFGSLSTEELSAMRGTVATEERDAFRSEWQSRVTSLSTEEKAALGIGANAGSSQGVGQRLRDGSGLGSMSKGANRGGGRR